MENLLKKISYLVYITLFIVLIESTIACGLLFSGYMYKEFDQEKADEMLEYIKENNRDYYDQLTNKSDSTYINEYNSFYEKKGHPLMIAGGFILFALSVHTALPLAVILFWIKEVKEEEPEAKTEEKEDEEPEK
ncbi:MAG TPA: hypothetical protein VMZ04_11190 [Anaerolineae bacterium]|nr:hypothetical protein [Anaerolineae bacterium]